MPNQRITDKVELKADRTLIGEATRLSGRVEGENDVFLDGEFEGNFNLDSLLFIGKTGKFKGIVEARNIVVEGRLEGEIKAGVKIELRQGGFIKGNVVCQSIAIAEGAYFEGKVVMDNGNSLTPVYFTEKRKSLQKIGDSQ